MRVRSSARVDAFVKMGLGLGVRRMPIACQEPTAWHHVGVHVGDTEVCVCGQLSIGRRNDAVGMDGVEYVRPRQ